MAKKLRLLLIIRMLAFTSFAYSFKLTGSCTGRLTTTAGNSYFIQRTDFPAPLTITPLYRRTSFSMPTIKFN